MSVVALVIAPSISVSQENMAEYLETNSENNLKFLLMIVFQHSGSDKGIALLITKK